MMPACNGSAGSGGLRARRIASVRTLDPSQWGLQGRRQARRREVERIPEALWIAIRPAAQLSQKLMRTLLAMRSALATRDAIESTPSLTQWKQAWVRSPRTHHSPLKLLAFMIKPWTPMASDTHAGSL